ARLPLAGVESVLLVLVKFAGDFNEIAALHRFAGSEVRVIAPDPQRHAIGGVGQSQLAIWFLLTGEFRDDGFELHTHLRLNRSLRNSLSDFFEGQQWHRGLKFAHMALD